MKREPTVRDLARYIAFMTSPEVTGGFSANPFLANFAFVLNDFLNVYDKAPHCFHALEQIDFSPESSPANRCMHCGKVAVD